MLINCDYLHNTYTKLTWNSINDKKNIDSKDNINNQDMLYFNIHVLIYNFIYTSYVKLLTLQDEIEHFNKSIEKHKNNPQLVMMLSQRLNSYMEIAYTIRDYINPALRLTVNDFYEKSAEYILSNVDTIIKNEPHNIQIIEGMIANMIDYWMDESKFVDKIYHNTVQLMVKVLRDRDWIKNPYTNIYSMNSLVNYTIKNPIGLELISYDYYRSDIVSVLITYYVKIQEQSDDDESDVLSTRLKILNLIHFLKDMNECYFYDMINMKATLPEIYNKFE